MQTAVNRVNTAARLSDRSSSTSSSSGSEPESESEEERPKKRAKSKKGKRPAKAATKEKKEKRAPVKGPNQCGYHFDRRECPFGKKCTREHKGQRRALKPGEKK